jgi:prephenate dehydrogenase
MAAAPWRGNVGIIGLGLMGGSLARELAACGVHVYGYDGDTATVRSATEAGVLHAALDGGLEGLADVDLLVLAVPVDRAGGAIAAALPQLRGDCVITDLGSTKTSIQEEVEKLGVADRFVGSHPLAGGHRSGWDASHRDLYAWSRVFLCPTPRTRPDALERVRALWELVGALPEVIDAAEHDRRVAWTSHLPQVAATALALALDAAGLPRRELGPGGRDTTRLAASSPEMWTAICLDNAALVEAALAGFEAQIVGVRSAIAARDAGALREMFTEAQRWAEEEQPPR